MSKIILKLKEKLLKKFNFTILINFFISLLKNFHYKIKEKARFRHLLY